MRKAERTFPKMFRMTGEEVARIEAIRVHYGLRFDVEAVRLALALATANPAPATGTAAVISTPASTR